MNSQLERLYERRGELAQSARQALEAIKANTDDMREEELLRNHDVILAKFDEIDEQIAVEKRSHGLGAPLNLPGGGHIVAPGVDSGDIPNATHEKAFRSWLRDPNDIENRLALTSAEKRVHSGTTDAAGGFTVPLQLADQLAQRARDENTLEPLVSTFNVETSNFRIPMSNSDATVSWAAELDTRNETGDLSFVARNPNMGTCFAYVAISEELLQDSQFDIQQYFVEEAGRAIGQAEMNAILTGAGGAAPIGILNTEPEAGEDGSRTELALKYLPTGSASTLGSAASDLLISTIYDLHSQYRRNGVWVMNSQTASVIRQLKDGQGNYIWQERLMAGQPAMLAGYPVVIAEAMDNIEADAFPILFGDFGRGYARTLMTGQSGLAVLSDPYTTVGRTKVYVRRRSGGIVFDERAVRAIKVATT